MKVDFLKECMAPFGPVPIDEFNRAFCVVCANRECSRSSANNMQFDRRAVEWKDRLFTSVPRASDDDPRYDNIRAKKFLPVVTSANLVTPSNPPRFEVVSPNPAEPTVPQITTPAVEVQIMAPRLVVTSEPISPTVPDNTPFKQGTLLTPPGEEKVLQPGGSFTFDSDE